MTRILSVENKVQPDERKRTTKKRTGEKKEEIHTKAIGTIAFPKKKQKKTTVPLSWRLSMRERTLEGC